MAKEGGHPDSASASGGGQEPGSETLHLVPLSPTLNGALVAGRSDLPWVVEEAEEESSWGASFSWDPQGISGPGWLIQVRVCLRVAGTSHHSH